MFWVGVETFQFLMTKVVPLLRDAAIGRLCFLAKLYSKIITFINRIAKMETLSKEAKISRLITFTKYITYVCTTVTLQRCTCRLILTFSVAHVS